MSRTETPKVSSQADPVKSARGRAKAAKPAPPCSEHSLTGIPISAGIAIGAAFGADEAPTVVTRERIAPGDVDAQIARLDAAIVQSRKQLQKLRARLAVLPEDSQGEIAPLLDAYLQMIGPSRLVRGAKRRIADLHVTAETAVFDEAELISQAIEAMPSPDDGGARARHAEEVREIGRRLVRNLVQAPFRSFAALPEGAILICENLRPSDAALLDPSKLAGVATEDGGTDGHTAIMLRALGIPAVLGCAGLLHAARVGHTIVLDGSQGRVVVDPSADTLAAARRAVTAFARERQKLGRLRRLASVTLDGEEVELQANLEIPAELPLIAQCGGSGIGLLRTEFLFMNRETLPDEAAQTETYRAVVEAMNGDPVTIRVLDWGGEKEIEALQSSGIVPRIDRNPALGLRGIRLLLREAELFETQLAAILRASAAGPVRVLLPMVTNVSEVRAARETYDRVVRRLRRRGDKMAETVPPLGIMIETPGAALAADALALEADFFAIGTNDLAMYTLAVDRGEADVAHLYDSLHPAVLRLVQFATEAALRMRMQVSVCGELAANPRLTPLLVGMGLRSFSMAASAVPRVKQAVRALNIDDCARFTRRVMEQSDPARIKDLVLGDTPG